MSDSKRWGTHRLACDPLDIPFGDCDNPVALWIRSWAQGALYTDFIKKLNQKRKGQLVEVGSEEQLATALDTIAPTAIILTDETLMGPRYKGLRLKIVQFARRGGIVVFACFFASRAEHSEQCEMWRKEWGLKWRKGNIHSKEYTLNAHRWSKLHGPDVKLPERKEMNAFCLVRTEKMDAVYVSRTEAEKDKPFWSSERGRSPVCFAHVGFGGVGFIGDETFLEAIPVMCSLVY
jgi:hypothetical protein